jgi:hypothetical protein
MPCILEEVHDMSDDYKLHDGHFEYFVRCCKFILSSLGFMDWNLSYRFMGDSGENARAMTILYDRNNRVASIVLFDEWDIPPDEFTIARIAFHECMEMILGDLAIIANDRSFSEDEYERASHRVIRTFENVLFPGLYHDRPEFFDIQSLPKIQEPEGSEVSGVVDPESSVHDSWLQRSKLFAVRWINRISSRPRSWCGWDRD